MNNIDPIAVAISFGVLLLSLTIHEAAHAWTADKLGDPTARVLGRVSLNPLVHIDWIGTVLLPIIATLSNLPLIGWAKPVPVDAPEPAASAARLHDRRRRRADQQPPAGHRRRGAAPAGLGRPDRGASRHRRLTLLFCAVQINLLLAFFNLIPVPPLDGGNVLLGLLPPNLAAPYSQLRNYGFIILYALMFTGVASAFIMPPTRFMMRLLIP